MTRGTRSMVGGLLSLAVAGGWWMGTGTTAHEPSVGLLDIGRAISGHKQRQDEERATEEWKVSQQTSLDGRSKEVEAAQLELESFSEGSPSFNSKAKELAIAELELKIDLDLLNQELARRKAQSLRDAYARVKAAAEQVRKQLGLEVVLQYNGLPLGGRDVEEIAREIVPRTVVTFDPDRDVTQAVIDFLDS